MHPNATGVAADRPLRYDSALEECFAAGSATLCSELAAKHF